MSENFFIIGAQRSGTTLLTHILDAHPEISMVKPLWPEPKWFLKSQLDLDRNSYMDSLFGVNRSGGKIYGEKSTSYYEYPEVARYINTTFPTSHIIVVLRDPVYRAISNYIFSLQHGLETRTLKEVFVEMKKKPTLERQISVDPFDYLKRGDYLNLLQPYLEEFGVNRLKVILYEELLSKQAVVQDIFNYLGLTPVEELVVTNILAKKVNGTQRNENIPEEVLALLTDYYHIKNEKLSNLYELDIGQWR